ncbi:MAG: hypothetical protein ACI8S6_002520 [Myxococcota bacterium]|jgi:hypothetical protein
MIGALALFLIGCDPECDDTSRINGDYIVNSHVSVPSNEVTGDNLDSYPYDGIFFNGWSSWELQYVPGRQSFQVTLDGQSYEAAYTQDPDNCNAFTLEMAGTYNTELGTTHAFVWAGDLVYLGVKLQGTFTYSDTWTDPTEGTSGSITVPGGELLANPASSDTSR